MAFPKEARVRVGVSTGGGAFYKGYFVWGELVTEKGEEKEQSIQGLVGESGKSVCTQIHDSALRCDANEFEAGTISASI